MQLHVCGPESKKAKWVCVREQSVCFFTPLRAAAKHRSSRKFRWKCQGSLDVPALPHCNEIVVTVVDHGALISLKIFALSLRSSPEHLKRVCWKNHLSGCAGKKEFYRCSCLILFHFRHSFPDNAEWEETSLGSTIISGQFCIFASNYFSSWEDKFLHCT